MRTSLTDPIRVDCLPPTAFPLPGRIGLTIAPGKKDAAGNWDRDLDTDLDRLRREYDARLLVCLLEDHELDFLDIGSLLTVARSKGMRAEALAIPDGGTPNDLDAVIRIVRVVLAVADAGDNVVLHCRGGLGRSGGIAACCLVALGSSASDASAAVRAARPKAIENRTQEQFIGTFGEAWRRARPVSPPLSRFIGCMLGGAIGDALGFPVALRGSDALFVRLFGSGGGVPETLPVISGDAALVSDKTQMTLFTAEGLIRAFHRSVDRGICSTEAVLARAYQRWLATQDRVVEKNWRDPSERGWLLDVPGLHIGRKESGVCLAALRQSIAKQSFGRTDSLPNQSPGAEGLTRSAPIGLVADSAARAFEMARDAAVITNGQSTAYLAAGCFAAIIWHIVRGASLNDAIDDALVLLPERDAQEIMLQASIARSVASHGLPSQHSIESLGDGRTALSALAIALVCARGHRGDSETSIRSSLWRAASHAGAGDTTASLTGSLLGAMYGVEALPPAWVADVEFRDVVVKLAQDLHTTFVLNVVPDPISYPPN